MDTATEETTVGNLIQELYDFPSDITLSFRDAEGRVFSLAGFEVGSFGVVLIINEE